MCATHAYSVEVACAQNNLVCYEKSSCVPQVARVPGVANPCLSPINKFI